MYDCVYEENASDKWNISWCTTRECCITILYHDIESTVANTINAKYAQHTINTVRTHSPLRNLYFSDTFAPAYKFYVREKYYSRAPAFRRPEKRSTILIHKGKGNP